MTSHQWIHDSCSSYAATPSSTFLALIPEINSTTQILQLVFECFRWSIHRSTFSDYCIPLVSFLWWFEFAWRPLIYILWNRIDLISFCNWQWDVILQPAYLVHVFPVICFYPSFKLLSLQLLGKDILCCLKRRFWCPVICFFFGQPRYSSLRRSLRWPFGGSSVTPTNPWSRFRSTSW